MEVCRKSSWLLTLLGVILLANALQGVQAEVEIEGPSETECRPYIEKALRNLENIGAEDADVARSNEDASRLDNENDEKQSNEQRSSESSENETETQETEAEETGTSNEVEQPEEVEAKTDGSSESDKDDSEQVATDESGETQDAESAEKTEVSAEQKQDDDSKEGTDEDEPTTEPEVDTPSVESAEEKTQEPSSAETPTEADTSHESEESTQGEASSEATQASSTETIEIETQGESDGDKSEEEAPKLDETEGDSSEQQKSEETEKPGSSEDDKSTGASVEDHDSKEGESDQDENVATSKENSGEDDQTAQTEQQESDESDEGHTRDKRSAETNESDEQTKEDVEETEKTDSVESTETKEDKSAEEAGTDSESPKSKESIEESAETGEVEEEKLEATNVTEQEGSPDSGESSTKEDDSKENDTKEDDSKENTTKEDDSKEGETSKDDSKEGDDADATTNSEENKESEGDSQNDSGSEGDSSEDAPEEELTIEADIPENLRDRDHVEQLLKLDREATKSEEIIDRISEITLRELKRLYENAIKPLETLYKYRDLSNRHYGDAEIFSKPLILFMGPWSGGKSSIINYLLNIEYNDTALRTGAEPSPAYFNLLMYGEEEEVLDGTQLAADYTFSGLQKFGQGLEERLRGVKLRSKLLEKVNIVEIPGILEVRKQVSRVFPFNDACQWFIDRADIIFLVYDPTKLDVGPETEAILDQLKGREYQTRIVLNKADQVKPEELMRVQGALIWNISPLMSSPQPPVMYTTSLWSRAYEHWAPVRLLQAQERAFLRDLRSAIDRRIENKIASARRFAVRVRNHAKMVDCYLTTYYNHKSIFGNRKLVSDAIIEHPQDYHIYEGLSTLTNISRYDLPDPDVYKDFFRLNALYEFQQLSATCTYFRGCPINKLDVAIAYDFPELVGKHKRNVETALTESNQEQSQGS